MKVYGMLILIGTVLLTAQPTSAPKVLHFKELQKFLPTAGPSGFSVEKPKGETVSVSGISASNASISFSALKKEKQLQTNDDGSTDSVEVDVQWLLSVQIADMSGMGEVAAASMSLLTAAEFENETESGYEKSITVGGYKGIEKISSQEYSRSCSLQLLVGSSYMVTVSGQGFADAGLLQTVVKGMKLSQLEKAVAR